jgi:hypothetical protein
MRQLDLELEVVAQVVAAPVIVLAAQVVVE